MPGGLQERVELLPVVAEEGVARVEVVAHRSLQGGVGAVVHPGAGGGGVAERRGGEGVAVGGALGLRGAAEVVGLFVFLAEPDEGDAKVVEGVVGEEGAVVAAGAAGRGGEEEGSAEGLVGEGAVVACEEAVEGCLAAVEGLRGEGLERREEALKREGFGRFAGEGGHDERAHLGVADEPYCECIPHAVPVVFVDGGDLVGRAVDGVFAGVSAHVEALRYMEECDRGKESRDAFSVGLFGLFGRREGALFEAGNAAVTEECCLQVRGAEKEVWCVTGLQPSEGRELAVGSAPDAACADGEREGVGGGEEGVVAGGAGGVAVAGEELAGEECLTEREGLWRGRRGRRWRSECCGGCCRSELRDELIAGGRRWLVVAGCREQQQQRAGGAGGEVA